MQQQDFAGHKTVWKICRYANDEAFKRGEPYDISEFEGNLLLNEGITALQNLLIGAADASFGNANTYIGVGDSSATTAASQTGLQAVTNKAYEAMEATYPQISSQTTTWRAIFESADANYAWREFTIVNASTDAGDNLNRKVSAQGTKASGQTWTVDVSLTWS